MRSIIAAVIAASLASAQTFRTSVDAVRVDALVTDGNAPITGLAAHDFEVRDNGVVQQIDVIAVEDVPVSVMFALDTSYSVRGTALDDLKSAATAALEPLGPADRAALVTFSAAVKVRADWTADRDVVRRALGEATASGGTALWDALYAALTLRDTAAERRSLVLLFSDGGDSVSWLPPAAVLERAKRSDAVVYAIGVSSPSRPPGALLHSSGITLTDGGPAPYEAILPQLCEITGGQRFQAADTRELAGAFRRIVQEFRTRYLLTFSPRGVAPDGWHTLDVKLKNRRGQVRARRGYLR